MMLAARTRTHLLSPAIPPSSSFRHFLPRHRISAAPPPLKMSTAATASAAAKQIVEHVVLFKAKPDAPASAMVNALNSLTSLNLTVHLAAAPVARCRSSSLTFTHLLHARYETKEKLSEYAPHPDHVRVVTDFVKPSVDDVMAVDWVTNPLSPPWALSAGSAVRITLVKIKEGGNDENSLGKILEVVGGIKDKFGGIEQLSYGENFSPERAKGYSVGSCAVFGSLGDLDKLDEVGELVEAEKGKVRDLIDGVVVLDYVVPPVQGASL